MNVTRALRLATLPGLLVSTGLAQDGLLYTTFYPETSTQCVSAQAINRVTTEEVQYAVPVAGRYSSKAFATQNGYCELLGDHDPDGDYWETSLFRHIDAVLAPRTRNGQPSALNQHSLFISSELQVVSAAGAVVAEPGDVFRIMPGGATETFLSMAQVQTAFGIAAAVDVDAVTLSFDPQLGGVFLSLEQTQTAHFGPVDDGDILWIPATAITWGTGFDGCVVVQSVASNSGQVHLAEAAVDAMCANSGVASCAGFAVTFVIDVNGLTWNAGAGELWFCGEYTTGCAVLTTSGGGQIAVLNGRAMGGLAPNRSNNENVGLIHHCGSSLNGLSVVAGDLPSFVTDTLPTILPGNVTIEAAGAPSSVWFLLNLLADVPGPSAADPSTPWPNACFPWLYPFLTHVGPVGTGCATFTGTIPAAFPGFHITVQGVSVDAAGAIVLSTPSVIDL